MRLLVILAAFALIAHCVDCAPFFDAIYDAINGNGRRSYGYSGYRHDGYRGDLRYNPYGYTVKPTPPRHGKTWKELCRVHYPQSVAVPGAGGIVCPN